MAELACNIMGPVQSYELGVLIHGLEMQHELIVDDILVKRNGKTKEGRIKVDIVTADNDRSAYLVELPRQITMGGTRVWVPKELVKESG